MPLDISQSFSVKELMREFAEVLEIMMPLIGLSDKKINIQNFRLNPDGKNVYITRYFSEPGILIYEGGKEIPAGFIVFDIDAFFLYAEELKFFDGDSIYTLLREIAFGELRHVYRIENKLRHFALHDMEVVKLLKNYGLKDFGDQIEIQVKGLKDRGDLDEHTLRVEIDASIIAGICTESITGSSDKDLLKIAEVLTLEKQHLFRNPAYWIAMIFGS